MFDPNSQLRRIRENEMRFAGIDLAQFSSKTTMNNLALLRELIRDYFCMYLP